MLALHYINLSVLNGYILDIGDRSLSLSLKLKQQISQFSPRSFCNSNCQVAKIEALLNHHKFALWPFGVQKKV